MSHAPLFPPRSSVSSSRSLPAIHFHPPSPPLIARPLRRKQSIECSQPWASASVASRQVPPRKSSAQPQPVRASPGHHKSPPLDHPTAARRCEQRSRRRRASGSPGAECGYKCGPWLGRLNVIERCGVGQAQNFNILRIVQRALTCSSLTQSSPLNRRSPAPARMRADCTVGCISSRLCCCGHCACRCTATASAVADHR